VVPAPGVGSCSDGDSRDAIFEGCPGKRQAGIEILTLDGSSGLATTRVAMSAEAYGSQSAGSVTIACQCTFKLDNRSALISSPTLEPSYYRVLDAPDGIHVRAQNTRNSDGSMSADAIAPNDPGDGMFPIRNNTMSVTYCAQIAGNWSHGSSLNWHSKVTGEAYSDWFSAPTNRHNVNPDMCRDIAYSGVAAGTEERVELTVTDSQPQIGADGDYIHPVAHALYRVRFHNEYEDPDTFTVKYGPAPPTRSTAMPDPKIWSKITELHNPTALQKSAAVTTSTRIRCTERLEVDGTTRLDRVAWQTLTRPGNFRTGETNSLMFGAGTTVTCAPNRNTTMWAALSYFDRTGACSKWGIHGYIGDVPWAARTSCGAAAVYTREYP
jgi:hypothetical protein